MIQSSQNNQNQSIEKEKKIDFPYISTIPYPVMIDKKLPAQAKLHFGCLVALSRKRGYCYATNEQLAEMHEVDVKQIKRWHTSLEENGHIKRETYNISYRDEKGRLLWKKARKIYTAEGFSKKDYDRGKNVPIVDRGKNVPINNKYIKEEKEIYKEKSKTPKANLDPNARKLAKKLFSLINKNFKSSSPPNLDKWSEELEKLHRIDKRSYEEIEKMIVLSQNHHYWRSRIRSAAKFRKYYAECFLQLFEKKSNSIKSREDLARAVQRYQAQYPGLDKVIIKEEYVENSRTKRKIYFNSPDFELELRESFDVSKISLEEMKKKAWS